ncbi:DNA-cytosine methyltransferase (EC 2.1.1.37) [uncultured Gammaproteobacteria bacterium]|nr:DNA-cytosine methyltransferase (EC 2.1.1.37) [uncultured Gammaproteobacteria bacterium]
MKKNHKKIQAIEFFCGSGGMSFGLQLAGINVFTGIDIDGSCRKTYEYNTDAKFIEKSIVNTTSKEINALFKESLKEGNYSMLAGCAPCQPYSPINTRKQTEDRRKTLLDEFGRIIKGVKPHFVLMENVSALKAGNQFFDDFIKMLNKQGYQYEYKVFNAKDFSVAQNRKRLFLIATRLKKIKLSFKNIVPKIPVVLQDVISHLEGITHLTPSVNDPIHRSKPLNILNLKRIKATPKNGGLRSSWADKSLISPCHRNKDVFLDNYGRLAWGRLSSTITTKFNEYYSGRFGHPTQDRALSLREGALIQSFPENYQFFGSETQIARQIGNAVPVNLSRAMGEVFIRSL